MHSAGRVGTLNTSSYGIRAQPAKDGGCHRDPLRPGTAAQLGTAANMKDSVPSARIFLKGNEMTVKAIYEDGVFKPKEKVELEDKTEVELEIKPTPSQYEDEDDPRSFVGFIKDAPEGVPIARDHDKYLLAKYLRSRG